MHSAFPAPNKCSMCAELFTRRGKFLDFQPAEQALQLIYVGTAALGCLSVYVGTAALGCPASKIPPIPRFYSKHRKAFLSTS
jgi:hypothetical protein